MIKRFEDFIFNIAAAQKYITKIKTHEMERFGLKASHFNCLYLIGKHPEGLTAGELVKKCEEDKAGISKAVAALKDKNLIMLDDDNGTKKYRGKYKITESGQKLCDEIREIIFQVVKECSTDFTDEERDAFYGAFEAIVGNLKKFYQQLE